MSYQALLFCPDEKTARVVSQVLSELGFQVESCHEPFAAVKKLMGQHFDAIVVDCDNEQNAALLFKSARNSGSNEASLGVAVVEGQAGVAKAFRLGANLVLTKPIHVEQSKGTLRVARGLLRKGQTGKPAVAVSTSTEPVAPRQKSSSASSISAASLSASSSASSAPVPSPAHPINAPPVASASAFELDAEPAPQPDAVDAALLEYMPDNAPAAAQNSQQSTEDSAPSKQYAWQPRSKPMAEPTASAVRRAAEVAGKSEFEAPAASHALTSQGRSGGAAAPARAREVLSPSSPGIESEQAAAAPPAPSKPASETSREVEAWGSNSTMQASEEPGSAALVGKANSQGSDSGTSKKILLAAILVLGIAAAGYFGWTKMQLGHPEPAPQSSAPARSGAASLPPNPASSADDDVAEQPAQISNPPISTSSSSKPSAAVLAAKTSAPAGVKAPAQTKAEGSMQETQQAPAATTGTNGSAAANASEADHRAPTISQTVSQGLLLKKVEPVYPEQALQQRLEGKVELQANISKTGSVTEVKQVSGDALLGSAAIDAVRQWKYKPYHLGGEPVDVETPITVNFKLP